MQRNWYKINVGNNSDHEYIVGEHTSGWKILFVRKNVLRFSPEPWRSYWSDSRIYGSLDEVCLKNFITKKYKLSQDDFDQVLIDIL